MDALARAEDIEGGGAGSLALLIAAVELNRDEDLASLLDSMLLDADDLRRMNVELSGTEDAPAAEIVRRAADRFDEVDSAALIVTAALQGSPRMGGALRLIGLSPHELAAQIAEWRLREAGDRAGGMGLLLSSALGVLASIATSVLLVVGIAQGAPWWAIFFLVGVWSGYPKEGPVVVLLIAGVLWLVVGPVVAVAQAVSVVFDVIQASIERRQLWMRTGIEVSLREQRHIVARLLTRRSRQMSTMRQLAKLHVFRPTAG